MMSNTTSDISAGDEEATETTSDTVVYILINEKTFPDALFRHYIERNFDTDCEGALTTSEIEDITSLDVCIKLICTLKGIEYFTALETLWCAGNNIASLDLRKNTALRDLWCEKNYLKHLDLSKNTALRFLYCASNMLTSLDVSKNTKLIDLDCADNKLESLDVRNNPALTFLNCSSNKLVSLDVNNNSALKDLWCYSNNLTNLDLSYNPMLTRLLCYNNSYTITPTINNTFDLSTLPNFDISKASEWNGGSVKGTILTIDDYVTEISYTYAIEKSYFLTIRDANHNPTDKVSFSLTVKSLIHLL